MCASLDHLPEEILAIIASFIPNQARVRLCLVNRKYNRIVEEHVYRRAELGLSFDEVPFYQSQDTCTSLQKFLEAVTVDDSRASYVRELRVQACNNFIRLRDGNTSTIERTGVLLGVLPNLKHLDLTLHGYFFGPRRYRPLHHSLLDTPETSVEALLFGSSVYLDGSFQLARIPGLSKLISISLGGFTPHWSWFSLPELREITVQADCDLQCAARYYPADASKIASIRTLNLIRYDWALFNNRRPSNSLSGSLRHFRDVQEFTLTVIESNRQWLPRWVIDPVRPGDWNLAVAQLQPLFSTLQILRIRLSLMTQGLYRLHLTLPITQLVQFRDLRTLEVHFRILFGFSNSSDHSAVMRDPDIVRLLPRRLEELHIWYPTAHIESFLNDLLEVQANFPYLKSVQLHCRADAILADDDEDWGVRAHELASTMPFAPIWTSLWEVGIRAFPVECNEAFDERWWNAEYAIGTLNAILAREAEDRWQAWYPHGFPCPVIAGMRTTMQASH